MPADQVRNLLLGLGLPTLAVVSILYVLLFPERAKVIAGWLWSLVGLVWQIADRRAVALRVEGDVNSTRERLLRDAPADLLEGEMQIHWADAEEAEGKVRRGDVVVFMRRSRHHDENVANAVMAYIPNAVLRTARRYLPADTMRAVDLTVARAFLTSREDPHAALQVFFDRHLSPARTDENLRQKLRQMDDIDLHGWLTRVLIAEYRRLGDQFFPGEAPEGFASEAEEVAGWLHSLATRPPGTQEGSLIYRGRLFRIGVIFVAASGRLEREGFGPYRRRLWRNFSTERCDLVYLMARDQNIPALRELAKQLVGDRVTGRLPACEYRLRSDFRARLLNKDRALCIPLHRAAVDEDRIDVRDEDLTTELLAQVFDPASVASTLSAVAPTARKTEARESAPATVAEGRASEPPEKRPSRVLDLSGSRLTTSVPEPAATSERSARRQPISVTLVDRPTVSVDYSMDATVHSSGQVLRGTVRVLPKGFNHGYLHDTCGHVWYFRRWELTVDRDWFKIILGSEVEFTVGRRRSALVASRVRFISSRVGGLHLVPPAIPEPRH